MRHQSTAKPRASATMACWCLRLWVSPATSNKHLNLLSLVFRAVKHKAKLTHNPWEEIQRKRVMANSRRELTIDELRKVCKDATGELRPLLALGIYTGLRLGDCSTLRWAEVDLPRGIIRRIPNKTARRNPKPVIVPVHPVLRDMLAETPLDKRGEYVLPEMATTYRHRSDLVTDLIQNHFQVCGIRLHRSGTGVDGKRAVVEVGFHSLRHTFVSMCRESNTPLAVVESIVGHTSPIMTRYYTRVGELAVARAVAMTMRPQISSDALTAYREAIEYGFGAEVDYGQIVKTYAVSVLGNSAAPASVRYSPAEVVHARKSIVQGSPDVNLISTSHVEKQNHTVRMHCRRLTRLTNAFSKKLENFEAAMALHFVYYNFIKTHLAIKMTPAMAAGVEKTFWTVPELVERCGE